MVILFVLGLILVGTALMLLSMATRSEAETTGINKSLAVLEAMSMAPSELTDDLDQSFTDRVMDPLLSRSFGIGRRLSGADAGERIRRRLELAGNPPGSTVDRVVSAKVVAAIGGFIVGLLFAAVIAPGFTIQILIVVGGLLAGFFGPNLYLYQQSYDREGEDPAEPGRRHRPAHHLRRGRPRLRRGAPAGGPQHRPAPSRGVPAGAAGDAVGRGRSDSLRHSGSAPSSPTCGASSARWSRPTRSASPSARCSACSRTRSASSAASERRRRRQVPVKIMIPVIFFIFPCLLLAVMGPAAISMMGNSPG